MKAPSLLFALVICGFTTFGQTDPDTLGNIYDDLFKKNKGTITLLSGNKIGGYLDFNVYRNALKLISEKNIEYLYYPSDVVSFEFFDETAARKRSFITASVTFNDSSIDGMYFMEVLHDHNKLLFLELNFPMTVERKTPDPKINRDKLVTEQANILYFMKQDTLYPYVLRINKEVEDLAGKTLTGGRKHSSTRVLDKSLPESIMQKKYPDVKKYASKKRLDWTDKDEMVAILNYWKSLN